MTACWFFSVNMFKLQQQFHYIV